VGRSTLSEEPVTFSIADEDEPDPIIDGKIDIGALAAEFFALGLDPYPRKPGAQFAPLKPDDAGEQPFAALQTLKKNLGGGQS